MVKAATSPPSPRGPATVLVIDDSEIARDHIQRLLSEAGLRVLTMASPIGATRTVLNDNVDVVVIDVLMPGMRGDKLAALFKSNPRFRNLGVVLVSGEDPAELSRLMKETRASAVVSKSDVRGIVGAVRSVLRQRPPVGGAGG